ncbi:DNA-3-methyladenine glycosylase I [Sporobacter termitidis DSM 10068]|uniref:DNA-3-methyladenine glycosylase I n=1 Tax=Sporobacter termitidis DSM 10068 TaxID=1123282 RepID=A0A1M5TG72_9FIRM|nr:DNA-3-methyladenine glycosylase I [Sporobacter termitidis]SHH49641.1 DNA-3-methyladenine glycosylase I [Sporobacter termitidis DSM 10068]
MINGNITRCGWCGTDELYVRYHDEEWGVPVHDDKKHFEFLVLESAQSGLSWLTILRKRENYRAAYDGFDPEKVAKYDEAKINELLSDPGIIRNRMKIEASVNNARRFLEIQKEFGSFDSYIWGFTGGKPVAGSYQSIVELPATSELSDKISKDLKSRGFKFLGSITVYSHIQAVGIVNDHIDSCFRKNLCGNASR